MGTVAPLHNRDQGGQEGADEPTVEPLIEGAQDGSRKVSQLTGEARRPQTQKLARRWQMWQNGADIRNLLWMNTCRNVILPQEVSLCRHSLSSG